MMRRGTILLSTDMASFLSIVRDIPSERKCMEMVLIWITLKRATNELLSLRLHFPSNREFISAISIGIRSEIDVYISKDREVHCDGIADAGACSPNSKCIECPTLGKKR